MTKPNCEKLDAITVEVLRSAFNAIADDMNAVLGRSAYSPVIYEMHDYGVAVFDEGGRTLGQSPGHPGFIGSLDWGVQAVLEKFGQLGIHSGDAFVINDSYVTGGHLSDVDVIIPIFYKNELVAFASSRAHWLDIGTAEPGFPVNTTNIFQEGLRLGATRIIAEGRWVDDVIDIMRWNTRMPKVLFGDLNAQVAAGRMAQRRFVDLLDRFGRKMVIHAIEQIYRDTETVVRGFVSQIPDGVYRAEGDSDDDFVTGDRIRVVVTVTVSGSSLIVDTTGSSPQATSGVNSGYANTVSAARLALMFLLPDPNPQVNYGSFVPLQVIAESGSIFAATEPAACMHPHPVMIMLDLVIRALAPVIPDCVAAGLPGDSWNVFLLGDNPATGEPFISGESLVGGWGANSKASGESAIIHSLGGDFRNVPVETLEARYPVRIRRLCLGTDSGGAGTFRGGLNIVKEYEVLTDCRLTLHFDRTKTPQWGLFGGGNGAPPEVLVIPSPGGPSSPYSKVEQLVLPAGACIVARTGGGGGFGHALARNPEAVLHDVRCGYVSREAAESVYGVVLAEDSRRIDTASTDSLRRQLRNSSADI
jgi:N-methylhydantoinase B